MIQAIKDIAENLGGTGVNLAARAISGVLDLIKNLAAMVGDQVGIGGGAGASDRYGQSSVHSANRMIQGQGGYGASASASSAQGSAPAKAPAKRTAARSRTAPAAKKKSPARARAAGRKKTATRTPGKGARKATRKATVKRDQLVRVLRHLTDGEKEGISWMSASELSAAAETAGAPILPGNVRKVIRLRGNDLVETRPRDGSRRGSLEYQITAAGRERLAEVGD